MRSYLARWYRPTLGMGINLLSSRWPITWSAWLGSPTWRTSNRTSQVRKIVHNFRYTESFSCDKVQRPLIFSAGDCVKVSPGFAAVFQITSNDWSVYPIVEIFRFSSVVRGNLGNYSKPRKNFDTVLCRKICVFLALYRMKFDLVLQKLWTILLVQEIREPNYADHVIGHLVHPILIKPVILTLLQANNKGADQPVHPCSLISPFVIHSMESTIGKLDTCRISIFYLALRL